MITGDIPLTYDMDEIIKSEVLLCKFSNNEGTPTFPTSSAKKEATPTIFLQAQQKRDHVHSLVELKLLPLFWHEA